MKPVMRKKESRRNWENKKKKRDNETQQERRNGSNLCLPGNFHSEIKICRTGGFGEFWEAN